MTRPNPSSSIPLSALLVGLLVALVPSQSKAQLVLESGGVEFAAPSIIEFRTTHGDHIDVQEITGRATATAQGFGRYGSHTAIASAESTVHVCETPCRFQLQRPMEVRVASHAVRLRPDGSAQRYLIDPENRAGSALGFLAISVGAAAVVSGAVLIGVDAIPDNAFEDNGVDMRGLGVVCLVAGGALLVTGIIVRVLSKGRIKRVDGFDF